MLLGKRGLLPKLEPYVALTRITERLTVIGYLLVLHLPTLPYSPSQAEQPGPW